MASLSETIPPTNTAAVVAACVADMKAAPTQTAATYSRTLTTITVTCTAHGYTTGHTVAFRRTTGTASIGLYQITVVDANTFTMTDTLSGTTSGNAFLEKGNLVAGRNVHSAVLDPSANGLGAVNFTSALPSANYAMSFSANNGLAGGDPLIVGRNATVANAAPIGTTMTAWWHCITGGGTNSNPCFMNVTVIGL